MNNQNTIVVCANHKVGVEIKAEAYTDEGYQMIDAPYFDELAECWCYRLNKPHHMLAINHN